MPSKEDALSYINVGIKIVPCHNLKNGKCDCGREEGPTCSPGKHPYVNGGAHAASDQPDMINQWWDKWPDANIGIPTGATNGGWYVLDVDNTGIAQKLLHLFTAERTSPDDPVPPPNVVVSQTGREGGGCHIYILSKLDSPTEILTTVDGDRIGELRGASQYVIAPPSMHKTGNQYTFVFGDIRTSDVMRVDDHHAAARQILYQVGVKVSPKRTKAKIDIGDISPINAIDFPFSIDGSNFLKQIMTGSYPQADRSSLLWKIGCEIWRYTKELNHPITLEEVAGIIKQLDALFWQKYTNRKDADKYYWEKASRARDDVASGRDQARKSVADGDAFYSYDDEKSTLFYNTGKSDMRLANFRPLVVEERLIIGADGEQIETENLVRCELPGESIDIILTTKHTKSDATLLAAFITQLPRTFRIEPHMERRVWLAANELAEREGPIPKIRKFAATGWAHVEETNEGEPARYYWAFVLPGSNGAITSDGINPSIVHHGFVSRVPERYNLYGRGVRPAETDEEIEHATAALTDLLSYLDPWVLLPIIDLILGAPLNSLGLRTTPPLVHLYGQTGQFKTSSTMAILSLLGRFTGDRDIPESWSSTVASLQQGLHALRDLPLLLDDYKTIHMKASDAARLVQNYADGTARSRMGSDQERRESLVPYAFLLSTGEERWENEQSSQARVFTVLFSRLELGSPELRARSEQLRRIQDHAENGNLALIGGTYLRYLAGLIEKYGDSLLAQQIADVRKRERQGFNLVAHPRVLDTLAGLKVIERFIGGFIKSEFPSCSDRWKHLTELCWSHQEETVTREAIEAKHLGPLQQVLDALRDALVAGTIHFDRRWATDVVVGTWAMPLVGFYDDEAIYLNKNTTWKWYLDTATSRREEIPFGWTTLRRDAKESYGASDKELADKGYIQSLRIPHEWAGLLPGYPGYDHPTDDSVPNEEEKADDDL